MSIKKELKFISPEWPAPSNVHAYSTTRLNGESQGKYSGLNFALHVDDDAQVVESNRQQLVAALNLPSEPHWLNQVHQATVYLADKNIATSQSAFAESIVPDADASISLKKNNVCVVMTADCLPLLICNRKGNKVAAVHAGWRGLADGVIEATIKALNEPADQLLVWLGPAIGPQAFEVGEEVREAFVAKFAKSELTLNSPLSVEKAFKQSKPGHYLADIYELAKLALHNVGVNAVYGGDYCTFTDADHFYSYRRDAKTGRQASLIWFS